MIMVFWVFVVVVVAIYLFIYFLQNVRLVNYFDYNPWIHSMFNS